jgi:hypothetical protein
VVNALGIVLLVAPYASDEIATKQLDYLLALSRECGLPLPPPDAVLVKCSQPGAPGDPFLALTLDGRTLWPNRRYALASIQCVLPDPQRLRDVDSVDWRELALVAHERGWHELALVAFRKWALKSFEYGWWTPENNIGLAALRYREEQIFASPTTPLPVIAKYLRRGQEYATEPARSRGLLRSVELALAPRHARSGSDDALIDALLDLTGRAGTEGPPGYRYDPRYRALLRRGFDAVPALIAHLADERVTRARGLGCGEPDQRRIRGVVLHILADLRGSPFAIEWDTPNDELPAIEAWFADARKLGEEEYLVSHLLGTEEGDGGFHEPLLWLLAEKYPKRLPDLFRKVIDTRPGQYKHAQHYAKAIAQAALPLADKRKILEYAASQENGSVGAAGSDYLNRLDPKWKAQLIRDLTEAPINPKEPRTDLAAVVANDAEADEWRALALLVRRSSAPARMHLLRAISGPDDGSQPVDRAVWKCRLALLAEYLTDDEARTDNPFPFSLFPRWEVRNFAALHLAKVLGLYQGPEETPPEWDPDPDWTAAEWAELRDKLRAKVKHELQR